MATDSPKPMSPTAAVARHLEWLEFALAAARDEEARRKGRLDKATSKNRDKRTVRLAEVSAEVVELSALVTGLKTLRGPGAAPSSKRRATTRSSTGSRRAAGQKRGTASSVAAAASAGAATAAPKATAAAPKAATARKAAPKPRAASAAKPRATTAAKPRATTARKTTRAGSKPSTARTRKPRTAAGTAPASPPPATAPTGPTV
jgi:hypothetical protein